MKSELQVDDEEEMMKDVASVTSVKCFGSAKRSQFTRGSRTKVESMADGYPAVSSSESCKDYSEGSVHHHLTVIETMRSILRQRNWVPI